MYERAGVVGVDVGTTSTKVVLVDPAGLVLAESAREYPLDAPRPGWAEQNPDTLVAAVLDGLTAVAAAARIQQIAIAGIAVSTAMHGLLALDAAGRPLTPLVTWADRRAADQAARLRADLAGSPHTRRSGTPLHPMSPLAKLLWYREERPAVFAAAARWVGSKEYVLSRLCGELVVDRSSASATGLYDVVAGGWDDDALQLAGIRRDQLAPLVACTDRVGSLWPEVADRVGLPARTPLIAGGSDGALANIGVGAVRPGILACSIGTSAALRVTVDRPTVDPAGRVFCYALDEQHWVVGGATNNGGNVLRWMHKALAPELPDASADRDLTELAGRAPAGAGGLLMLPHLAGERAPRWQGDPRGVYFGLTAEHRREHLVRAGLEAVCLQLALVRKSMKDCGIEAPEIRATGGFVHSPLWRQILADVFDRPVGYSRSQHGSAFGAAIVGMCGLGLLDGLDAAAELTPIADTDTPGPAAAVYARLLPLYDALHDALEPCYAELARLAEELGPADADPQP